MSYTPHNPHVAALPLSEPEHIAHEVVPGIWQLTVAIPFPLKTVNMYALVGKTGWVLVDTAIGTPGVREAMKQGLAQAGLAISQLQAIVLTHNHPDHIGLSGMLYAQQQVPIYMHPIDSSRMHAIWGEGRHEQAQSATDFFSRHGLVPSQPWYLSLSPSELHSVLDIPPATAFVPLEDGQVIELADEHYQVIWTPGHSDGQICLFRTRDGLLLSADHVLPRITPNIGLYSFAGRRNPLGDYLASLHKVEPLPAQLILPGHGTPFTTLTARIAEIIEHHQRRLQQILELLAPQPRQANQLMEQLFGARLQDDESRRLALAEVLAHLEYLCITGALAQQETEAGILYYIVSTVIPENKLL